MTQPRISSLVSPGRRFRVVGVVIAALVSLVAGFVTTSPASAATITITSATPSPASGTDTTLYSYKVTASAEIARLKFQYNGNLNTYFVTKTDASALAGTAKVTPSADGLTWTVSGDQLSAGCPRTITVWAYDSAGNVSASKSFTVSVGSCAAAPSASSAAIAIVSAVASPASGTDATLYTYTVKTNVAAAKMTLKYDGNLNTYTVYSDGQGISSLGSTDRLTVADKGLTWTISGDQLNAGSPRIVTVVAYDAAGKASAAKQLRIDVSCSQPGLRYRVHQMGGAWGAWAQSTSHLTTAGVAGSTPSPTLRLDAIQWEITDCNVSTVSPYVKLNGQIYSEMPAFCASAVRSRLDQGFLGTIGCATTVRAPLDLQTLDLAQGMNNSSPPPPPLAGGPIRLCAQVYTTANRWQSAVCTAYQTPSERGWTNLVTTGTLGQPIQAVKLSFERA